MKNLHLSVVALVLAGASTLASPALADPAVAVNTAVIFAAPGLNHARIGQLSTGEWVNVEHCEGEWCFIKAASGRKGWAAWKLLAAPGQGWQGGTAKPSATPEPPGTKVFNGTEIDAGAYQPPGKLDGALKLVPLPPFSK